MATDTSKPAQDTSNGTTVPLKHPITVDGADYVRLQVRRPKVRDLLHAAKLGGTDAEQEVNQFATLAGVAPKVIEELDLVDYKALQETVQAFLS